MLRYDWDDSNRRHIARHSVSPRETEEAINSDTLELAAYVTHGEQRYEEVGITDAGRILVVITTIRQERVRVVTAYDASRAQKLEFLTYHRGLHE